MADLFVNANTFLRMAASAWRHRDLYVSPLEASKALLIRLCFTNIGRRLVSDRLCTLRLHEIDQPIYVRRCQSDYLLVEHIFQDEEYSSVQEWSFPANATIVDLGANVGLASLYFSRLIPRCRIVAVEPDGGNLRVLRLNCQGLIERGQLGVVEGFIAAEDGVAGIDRSVAAMGFSKIPLKGPSDEAIRCISMSTLITQNSLGRIDLLKCDIEGGEVELFRSAKSWIDRVGHIIAEVHPPYRLEDFYRDLQQAGWDFVVTRSFDRDEWRICFLKRASG